MRSWYRAVGAALILCAAVAGQAAGQEKPRLKIVVEELSEAAAKCGLTESGIESTVALTLRNNGILTAPDTTPWLYALVNVLFSENTRLCVISTHVSVRSLGVRTVGAFAVRQGRYPTNMLCNSGGVSIANQAEAARRFSVDVEELIKNCLGRLEY